MFSLERLNLAFILQVINWTTGLQSSVALKYSYKRQIFYNFVNVVGGPKN